MPREWTRLPSRQTKIAKHMAENKIKTVHLYRRIKELFPDDPPITMSKLTRIIKGQDANLTYYTAYKIMNALRLTPNDIMEWESQWRQE